MGHLHICYIMYSICIERWKRILPSWPQIHKPYDVINGCYVIFGYPSSHKIDLNAHKTAIKCPRKRPPQMHIKMPSNAHKDAAKNAHKNTYAQLMHHYNNLTLMCRYLKSCTTRLFSRQLFHRSWRLLLVLCMWSTVYRWIPLTDGQ